MESDYILDILSTNHVILAIAVTALVVALIAVFSGSAARRKISEKNRGVKERVDSLWADMNELQVSQFNGPGAAGATDETAVERFSSEKAAYEHLWPMVWVLHEKLGLFIRAVESDESGSELRLDARNAALDARSTLNRVRPFCHSDIDELVTQLIDNHIKAHLAACHLMDLRKESPASRSSHEQEVQKEKFHVLYNEQAREMLNKLVVLIRQRMVR